MNKYLLLNHGVGAPDGWEKYFAMLHDKGYMVGGSALDHGFSVHGGQFAAASSPTVTGYIVVQAEDLETAKSLALQCPVHLAGGTVEVFTLIKS